MAKVRLAVIVSEFGAAMHMGADVERSVRTFDLPLEIAEYIDAHRGHPTTTVTLAIEDTP